MAECVATVTLGGGFVVGRGSEAELGSSIGIFSYFLQGDGSSGREVKFE